MRYAVLLMVAAAVATTGCGRLGRDPADCFVPDPDSDRYARGLVLCLSGAGGMMGETGRIHQGLRRCGLPMAIEEFDWSTGLVLIDQLAYDANRRKARALARRVEAYQDAHPGRPVHLVGVSAGTGLVVWALEDLAPERRVDSGCLIASSLWHRYDLTEALEKVRGRVCCVCSPQDGVLGCLVPVFGTVDRINGLSGGLHGFEPPAEADAHTRGVYEAKLVHVAWERGDEAFGHDGGHLGATSVRYVANRIGPFLDGRYDTEGRRALVIAQAN